MRLQLLGTGAAGGVPLYGCHCPACDRARQHAEWVRRPCSALVESGSTRILLDAGLMDLTERFPPGQLDAIVLTHFHPDHVQGLFHLRWGRGEPIPVYCPPDEEGCADLFRHHGLLRFMPVQKGVPFAIGDLSLTPVQLVHSRLTYGYHVRDPKGATLAYLTDTVGLPDRTLRWLQTQAVDVLCIDASYPPQATMTARNHNDLCLALQTAQQLNARQTLLTHIGHEADAWLMQAVDSLPPNVEVGRDGVWKEIRNTTSLV